MGYIFVYIESYIDRAKVESFFDKKIIGYLFRNVIKIFF